MSEEIKANKISNEITGMLDEESNNSESYELFGVPSYLSLMKKYPEAREELLRLRASKNQALLWVIIGSLFVGSLFGYFINIVSSIFTI